MGGVWLGWGVRVDVNEIKVFVKIQNFFGGGSGGGGGGGGGWGSVGGSGGGSGGWGWGWGGQGGCERRI